MFGCALKYFNSLLFSHTTLGIFHLKILAVFISYSQSFPINESTIWTGKILNKPFMRRPMCVTGRFTTKFMAIKFGFYDLVEN